MTLILPRYHAHTQRIQDERKLARILLDTGQPAPPTTATKATLPGDTRRLRGIPIIGGISGTSPGTDPLHETIRRNDKRTPR